MAVDKLPRHPLFDTKCFVHFSFVVVDNTIIEYGWNSHAPPDKHWGYDKLRKWSNDYVAGTHSELCAFKRARGLLRGAAFDMVNVRLGLNNTLRMSAPCSVCQSWLGAVGCRYIAFTVEDGWAEMVA